MKKSSVSNEDLGQDIAVILNTVKNIDCTITEMKGRTERLETRVTAGEISESAMRERISNITIFQSVFSIVIGAIATFIAYSLK